MKTMFAPSRRQRICGIIAVCAMTAGVLGAQSPTPRIRSEITSSEQVVLKSSQHPLAQAQNDAGRVPADTRLEGMSIYFNHSAAQEADLQALLAAQQDPASKLYHQWLTPDQFAVRFGMAQSDIDQVSSWLQQQGFSIDSVARSRNAIRFSGTVGQVESAFSTQMHYYAVAGSKHLAPSTGLSVPAAMAPVVESIRNLNDFKPKAMHIAAPAVSVRPTFTSSVSGSVFFAPGDIKTVYDVNPVLANYNGTGQSIAIMGQSSIVPSDITNFQVASGLTPKAPTLVLVPGSGSPTVYSGDESESDLDLEWSGAMAPGANIILVYTGNSANSGGIWDSMAYAVDERLANIISVSYATCEPELGTFTLEPIFQQAAAQGQTIFAASGDQGSTSCSDPISTTIPLSTQQALAVNYPASSPYVTGVGGTEVSQTNAAYYTQGQGYWTAQNTSADVTTSALKYIPEVAWNDDASSGQASAANGGGLSATGGGASTLFTKPAWQTGVPGIPSDGKRDVPDVALYSSPAFVPYLLCSSDQSMWQSASINGPAQAASCSGGTFRDTVSGGSYLTAAGGTSFATPIFAGMVALINQQKGYVTGQGLINPSLYTLASNSTTYKSAFNDITSGNNNCTAGTTFGYCSSSGSTEGYAAGAAYDLVTGLGSVDLSNLATAWSKNAGTSASLTSSTTTVSASNGAPNVGASVTFTITVAPSTGTGIPTGTVNLSIDGGGTSFSNGGTTATATLTSNGTATYATSFSTAGTHEVVAQYAGDSTFAASTGTASVAVAAVNSGTGTFKIAATAVTVAQGSSSSSTITVTPAGGYTGTVDIGFSTSNDTALTNLCYSFTTMLTSGDGSVAVTGTAAATTQLTLDTNAADCVSPTGASQKGWRRLNAIRSGNSSRNTGTNPAPAAFAFAGLLLAGFLGRSSRKLRNLACVIALVAAGFAVTACGSSSVNSTVQNPPKGTYTFTLTGTDTATATNTATTTFTFTIN